MMRGVLDISLRRRACLAALAGSAAAVLAGVPAAIAQQDVKQDWSDITQHASPTSLAGENPRAVAADLDGNVYVTGRLANGNNWHMAVWKYDSAGTPQPGFPVVWPPLGEPRGTDFGGVAVAVRVWGISGQGTVVSIPPEIYVVGYGRTDGPTGLNFIAMKLDAAGNVLWQPPLLADPQDRAVYRYYEGLDDIPVAAAVNVEGHLYVTGTVETNCCGTDIATVKFDGDTGVLASFGRFMSGAGQGDDAPRDIALRSSGEPTWSGEQPPLPTPSGAEVFVVGSVLNDASRGEDYITLAFNKNISNPFNLAEQHLWHRYYYHPQNPADPLSPPSVPGGRDVATSVAATTTDGYNDRVWVTGFSDGVGTGADYATLCYDMYTGADAWPNGPTGGVRYNNSSANGPDMAVKIVAGAEIGFGDKHVYVTGKSLNADGNYDISTIAYTSGLAGPGGIPAWSPPIADADNAVRFNGTAGGDDQPMDMTLAGTGGLVVTGSSDNGFGTDMRTIKYVRGNGDTPWLSTSIGFPQVPDGQSYAPMGMATAPNPNDPELPFIIVVGRAPGVLVTDPLRLGTVQYEQCAGNCPP